MAQYLSTIIQDEDLENIHAGDFNVIQAPRGLGKTTFMFDDRILKFSRAKKHVLYLVQNKVTRDTIVNLHSDKAVSFNRSDTGEGWFINRKKSLWTIEQDEDKIHVMCYQTFAALLRNEGPEWLDDIDLIVWDEFDDIKGYYDKEVKQLKKMLPDFSYEKLVNLLQEGKSTSIINFVYQIKNIILDPAKIKLIAISATPENAAIYFRDYINYILKGKLEDQYDAQNTILIDNVILAAKEKIIRPDDGHKYWCFTKYISEVLRLYSALTAEGFTVLMMWSPDNKNYRDQFTKEQADGLKYITSSGQVPPQYNFILTTGVIGRSISVYDTSIQDWICNSNEYEDVGQFIRARFAPERQYLLNSAKGLIDFIHNGFAVDYYNWHTISEIKTLLEEKPIYSSCKEVGQPHRLTTFSAVKKEYPNLFEKRIYGSGHKTQYRIKPAE